MQGGGGGAEPELCDQARETLAHVTKKMEGLRLFKVHLHVTYVLRPSNDLLANYDN